MSAKLTPRSARAARPVLRRRRRGPGNGRRGRTGRRGGRNWFADLSPSTASITVSRSMASVAAPAHIRRHGRSSKDKAAVTRSPMTRVTKPTGIPISLAISRPFVGSGAVAGSERKHGAYGVVAPAGQPETHRSCPPSVRSLVQGGLVSRSAGSCTRTLWIPLPAQPGPPARTIGLRSPPGPPRR